MTYPATNSKEASELLIDVSNQMHDIVNEDAVTEVTTDSGPVPSVRKALADTFLFVEPVTWSQGSDETVFNQLREFNNEIYWAPSATVANPIPMGATPVGDSNWKIAPTSNRSYVKSEDTKAQEELLPVGSQIYPEVGTIENGDIVTAGTTHLRVDIGGEPNIVAMSPVTSGSVSALTETSATIGVIPVKFINRGELANSLTLDVQPGDSLSDAIIKALSYRVINVKSMITINLKTGFSLQEQVDFDFIDASRITIVSEDPEVTIVRSALTVKNGRWYSAFRFKNANAPVIGCLFAMDSSGTATERTSLYNIHTNCEILPGCGFKNSGERNIDNTQCSSLVCGAAILTGAGTVGVRNATGSRVFGQFADVSDCGTGLSVGSGANASCANLVATNCSIPVSAQGATTVIISDSDLSGSLVAAVSALNNSVVDASGSTIENCQGLAVDADRAANVDINGSTISSINGNAQSGVRSTGSAVVNAESCVISGEFVNSLYTRRGGVIDFSLGYASGATGRSLYSTEGGKIIAFLASARRGISDDTNDVVVNDGGEIVANNLVDGGLSQTPNVNKPNGIIKTDDIVSSAGVAEIPEAAVAVVVNHGLTVQPFSQDVSITPYSNLNGVSFWFSAVTSTTFTINISSPAPVGGLNFRWTVEKFN